MQLSMGDTLFPVSAIRASGVCLSMGRIRTLVGGISLVKTVTEDRSGRGAGIHGHCSTLQRAPGAAPPPTHCPRGRPAMAARGAPARSVPINKAPPHTFRGTVPFVSPTPPLLNRPRFFDYL